MKRSNPSTGSEAQELCLACGFCCNGVIFADLKLQPADDAAGLQALGLTLQPLRPSQSAAAKAGAAAPQAGALRLLQPCSAYSCGQCRVYGQRPTYCRQFECALLKGLTAGRIDKAQALRLIRKGRLRAEKVLRLLRQLGDTDEQLSLGVRFRRTSRRLQGAGLQQAQAALYGQLTLAMHDLNLLLGQEFYPG